jgi:hypothetical protein
MSASVHVSNIKSKLGANGRAEIAAIAVRLGLVPETTDEYGAVGNPDKNRPDLKTDRAGKDDAAAGFGEARSGQA